MDTFVDSSWYYFRYCSPGYESGPFRPQDVERWMPVAQYTGGVEHAILHLLYSRFFTKVLFDMGLVSFAEPFPRLMNQGQVIHGGASMSKSKGNIVEPMPIVERWGADTMRLTMLFAGPFEDDIDWKLIAGDPDKRPGVNSWLGRVFADVALWRPQREGGVGARQQQQPVQRRLDVDRAATGVATARVPLDPGARRQVPVARGDAGADDGGHQQQRPQHQLVVERRVLEHYAYAPPHRVRVFRHVMTANQRLA